MTHKSRILYSTSQIKFYLALKKSTYVTPQANDCIKMYKRYNSTVAFEFLNKGWSINLSYTKMIMCQIPNV